MTIRVGEQLPEVVVSVRGRHGRTSRRVEAEFKSTDPEVLAPDGKGGFVGKVMGRTQLQATFQGKQATAEVRVVGNPFQSVQLPDAQLGSNRFTVSIQVEGVQAKGQMEYRVFPLEAPEHAEWKTATADGDRVKITLQSPSLRLKPTGTAQHP